MPIPILMPALSPTMEKGKLAKWLVKEGDNISSGDVLAEIETDKATMEVEAVDEGTVGKLMIAQGTDDVPVNETIAVLLEEGEDTSDIGKALTGGAAAGVAGDKTAAHANEADKPTPAPINGQGDGTARAATGSAGGSAAGPASHDGAGRIFSSPLARRIAKQNDIDLTLISGSGPRGRIIKRDIEQAIAHPPSRPSPSEPATQTGSAPAPSMSDAQVLQLFDAAAYDLKPHDGMRKTIAARLTQSHQTIPSYLVSMDCKLDALLALRGQVNGGAPQDSDGKPAFKLSVNDFIIKALALALKQVPMANASWTSSDRVLHKHADVGVAVAIPDGLITPIVRQAELKTLSAISAEVKDMAKRARDKKLKPEEYQGGTTAVSNLGMFGVDGFTSIINPPHASIVSIGAGVKKPVVHNDEIAVATMMNATFAFDHRVIDGALGAELAAAFKGFIENPMTMLV